MLRNNPHVIKRSGKAVDDDMKIYGKGASSGNGRIKKDPSRAAHNCNIPVLPVIFIMILTIVSERLLSGNYINSSNPYVSVVATQLCTYLIPCAFFAAFSKKDFKSSALKLCLPNKGTLGFAASCIPLLFFGCTLLKYVIYNRFGITSSSSISAAGSSDFLYVFLSSVLIPALCEELVLRGVIFTEYEKRVGVFGAYLATTVLFALIHFNISDFLSYIFAGLILGLVLHITRSVFAPMLLHLLNNLLCIYGNSFLARVAAEKISASFVSFILVVLFLISLYVFAEMSELVLEQRADKLLSHEETEEKEVLRLLPHKRVECASAIKAVLCPAFFAAVMIFLAGIVLR